ncbi:hypothetical protein [Haloglomus salinum]|jgi:hypothetical protein|uniref:hypothetical protein n=1 Tax=Haloglomus salinum TaxID=2962673 RepID=UPI0020C9ACB4|nr:hypothetical protein [Haloglomus salinum]
MEGTVTRSYDVSHLTRSCDVCGEFERHVNQRVVDQYEAFEADPPEGLDWAGLDRTRKFVVAERVARHGRSVESLAGDRREPEIESDEETAPDNGTAGERPPADAAVSGESADATDPDSEDAGDGEEAGEADTAQEAEHAETDPDPDGDGDAPAGHDSTPSGSD